LKIYADETFFAAGKELIYILLLKKLSIETIISIPLTSTLTKPHAVVDVSLGSPDPCYLFSLDHFYERQK